MNKFEDLKKKINKARDEAKKTFGDGFSELFEKYPKLESVGWTQYTPYWNDGEACTFSSCHEYSCYINNVNSDDFIYEKEEDQEFSQIELDEIQNYLSKIVGQFDNDDLKYMFGEGIVTVHKNGLIKTEDCEHD